MAAKIVFLMTMRGVFRPDLPLSFFSVLYRKAPRVLGPPPLRESFFLENGALRDTREKNPEIGSKNVTD